MSPLTQITVILLVASAFVCTNGYPNGLVQDACSSMVPNHNANTQTSASPYSLSLSKSTYSGGQQITVTLTGSSQFLGFLIQARSGSSSTPLGSFKASGNAQTLDCTSAASAVSQTSGSSKSSVAVTWVAPANSNADIQLRATVVQSERVFWTGILSSKLTYNATSNGFQHTAPLFHGLFLSLIVLWI
ncbi:putative ferric-chelate reductase 1 [Dendropsophus ebraccatus]|uniref:putative ferric-chelate reductase 1 n=1 Tax=Dendropsophus ebraccatus TaxID=150705 RepID=UPI0038319498